ncbi:lycopene cyclase domain-containing protein [Candidatus Saccharibacteria bacterium]|nr:lycopene cyclase domain-containing protein [Candidatus Saccharibacteria bacterium]NCU40333.1 lycopene cyclase domain-containing protein [Candidatus Saccharibacteria bacterium]
MTEFAYMLAITLSFIGILIIDKKYNLAFFFDIIRTTTTLLIGVLLFSLWDILGVALNIFFSGSSPYMSGWYIAPEFPVEEIMFLTFLCYFTLVLYRLLETRWRHI